MEYSKLYYTIGEAAQMLNKTPVILRYWTKKIPQLKPMRNAKGNRYYSQADMKLLEHISFMIDERGYSIEGVIKQLEQNQNNIRSKAEAVSALLEARKELVAIMDELAAE